MVPAHSNNSCFHKGRFTRVIRSSDWAELCGYKPLCTKERKSALLSPTGKRLLLTTQS
jgi:hypothetical protein